MTFEFVPTYIFSMNFYKEINIITEEIEYVEVLNNLKADFIIGYDLKVLVFSLCWSSISTTSSQR